MRAVEGTWRYRYGCQEPLCRRERSLGRLYCPAHDRPDAQIRAEAWWRDHPGEQLPCAGCSHRRIYHHRLQYELLPSAGRGRRVQVTAEESVPCSMPDCSCQEYVA